MTAEVVHDCLLELSQEAKELHWDAHVPVLESPPSPVEFYRDWVGPNKPVLIRNATSHWPAQRKWSNDYLREKVGTTEVTVAVTPNGHADAVNGNKFVMPEERMMTFGDFLDIISTSDISSKPPGVFYVQKQNSNMTDEFKELLEDVEEEISWASQALNKTPDAINFWMGEEKAVTSMHKDHYENLYSVIRGHKTFTLIPPTDRPFVPYETYQAAVYRENGNGKFDIIDDLDTGQVPWIAVDPLNPDLERYPEFRHAHPVTVTVQEGEMLYLPSLWFHHVQQSQGCIAVNHWYDMEYDIKYSYFQLLENMTQKLRRKHNTA